MYDKLSSPPTPGTPLESVMLLVWRMRQDIEFQRTRVMVNAVLAAAAQGENIQSANKELQDAWQDFLDESFPYQKGQRVKTDEAAIEFLKQEVAKGPLTVTPLQPVGKASSKLKTRWFKREEEK
jgi:hypothetical protein